MHKRMFKKDDEWYTPRSAFVHIKSYIPKKVIWEPFCMNANIESVKYLKDLGYDVVTSNVDFFKENKGEIIITNPPFTKKQEVIKRLLELKKPFIIILPITVLFSQYFRTIMGQQMKHVQIIFPDTKIQFYKLHGKEKDSPNNCSFYSIYVCYKMSLPKDVIFLHTRV